MWTAAGAADSPRDPEPIRINYTAPESCPSREAFVERLRTRTTRFREALEGDQARIFTIEFVSGSESSRGRLTVVARDGSSTWREVRAATCELVQAALALVVAVAIDPLALTEPPPPPPKRDLEQTAAPPQREMARRSELVEPPRRFVRSAIGMRWDEVGGITPLLRPVLRPFVEIAAERRGILAPALRISFAWTRNAHVAAGADGADISWYAARAEACPLLLGSAPVSLSPCLTFDAGALTVTGENDPPGSARTRPWLSSGLDARGSLRIWRWLFAELELGAAVPWIRDRWIFSNGTALHTTPLVIAWMGTGLGCRFP